MDHFHNFLFFLDKNNFDKVLMVKLAGWQPNTHQLASHVQYKGRPQSSDLHSHGIGATVRRGAGRTRHGGQGTTASPTAGEPAVCPAGGTSWGTL